MLSSATLLCVVAVVLCVLVVRLTLQLRARARELEQARLHMLRYAWLEWWTRNAAETTPLEPARPYMLALSQAAALAPDLPTFVDDCTKLASNVELPPTLRSAARAHVDEWDAVVGGKPLPWVAWARETGKPIHNAHAQRTAYLHALQQAVELSLCIPSTSSSSAGDNPAET